MNRDEAMTHAEQARWTAEWEDYVSVMERMRDLPADVLDLPADVLRGFLVTLRQIRALPEVER